MLHINGYVILSTSVNVYDTVSISVHIDTYKVVASKRCDCDSFVTNAYM